MRLKVLFLSFFVLGLTAPLLGECDCSHWPWPPECQKPCTAKILQLASEKELAVFLDLDKQTIQKIILVRSKKKLVSPDDLKPALTESQIQEINVRIARLTRLEIHFLVAPREERNTLGEKMGKPEPI